MSGRASWIPALLVSVFAAVAAQSPAEPPPAEREFRAAWVATVANTDWPSRPGLPVAELRRELDALLDEALQLGLNALVFQVRPAADAFYRSALEPWSEWLTGRQGRAPDGDFDPLEHAVRGAHARGLELHAWFNPYRARHRAARSPLTDDHPARQPGWAVNYGDYLWFDPGHADVPVHVLRVILDVVDRYDIDGVHLDDYFYPYPQAGATFDDAASYRAYRQDGGRLARDDWRRANVDRFVQALHRGVKQRKPWVKVGISPFGIVRPGVPPGIQAGIDQYADLYADVRRWLDEGWCDYVSPQLYWPIDDRPHSFATLLDWWAEATPERVHLWVGQAAYKAAQPAAGWSVDELVRQIARCRARDDVGGQVLFSMQWLRDDSALGRRLREDVYRQRALIPASPWLDRSPPFAPELAVGEREGGLDVRWKADPDGYWQVIYLRCGGRWNLVERIPAERPGFRLTAAQRTRLAITAVAVSTVDRYGNESRRTVRAVGAD